METTHMHIEIKTPRDAQQHVSQREERAVGVLQSALAALLASLVRARRSRLPSSTAQMHSSAPNVDKLV